MATSIDRAKEAELIKKFSQTQRGKEFTMALLQFQAVMKNRASAQEAKEVIEMLQKISNDANTPIYARLQCNGSMQMIYAKTGDPVSGMRVARDGVELVAAPTFVALDNATLAQLRLTEMGDWLAHLHVVSATNTALSYETAKAHLDAASLIEKRLAGVSPLRFASAQKIESVRKGLDEFHKIR